MVLKQDGGIKMALQKITKSVIRPKGFLGWLGIGFYFAGAMAMLGLWWFAGLGVPAGIMLFVCGIIIAYMS